MLANESLTRWRDATHNCSSQNIHARKIVFGPWRRVDSMISDRIYAFLAHQRLESPCLVLDREVVCERYRAYARALPNTKIYYAVKANPHPAILGTLS